MDQVGRFEKVSFEQFRKAMQDEYGLLYDWLNSDEHIKEVYDSIELPSRATSGSAGYDFKVPFEFTLNPGNTIKIPTGIRVRINDGWFLGCVPRSSLGFKYRFQLDNTIGVIDSDYYYSDNEGHIFAKVSNDGRKDMSVKAGDGFMQGIFLPYGITYGDNASAVRNGGMGSTGN